MRGRIWLRSFTRIPIFTASRARWPSLCRVYVAAVAFVVRDYSNPSAFLLVAKNLGQCFATLISFRYRPSNRVPLIFSRKKNIDLLISAVDAWIPRISCDCLGLRYNDRVSCEGINRKLSFRTSRVIILLVHCARHIRGERKMEDVLVRWHGRSSSGNYRCLHHDETSCDGYFHVNSLSPEFFSAYRILFFV